MIETKLINNLISLENNIVTIQEFIKLKAGLMKVLYDELIKNGFNKKDALEIVKYHEIL